VLGEKRRRRYAAGAVHKVFGGAEVCLTIRALDAPCETAVLAVRSDSHATTILNLRKPPPERRPEAGFALAPCQSGQAAILAHAKPVALQSSAPEHVSVLNGA